MTALTLGPVAFDSFEVPDRISFGGQQRLCVHRLPGGARVVDVMGPDDAPILWSGVFSGETAAGRVRQLDLLRSVGAALLLTWDDFVFEVVIAGFEVAFEQPNWIPYRLSCVVLTDLLVPQLFALSLAASLGGDIAAASGVAGLPLDGVTAALAVPGATALGTLAYGQGLATLGQAAAAAVTLRDQAGVSLQQARSVPQAAAAAGQAAQAAQAAGYLQRAQGNLQRAGG